MAAVPSYRQRGVAEMYDEDDDRNSSASSDFFSPVSLSFFRSGAGGKNKQQAPAANGGGTRRGHHQQNHNQQHRQGTTAQQPQTTTTPQQLPKLHDSSWIGARLSPIGSFDQDGDDDDDEDDRHTSVYHRALHESLEAAPFVTNEQTSLLGRLKKQHHQQQFGQQQLHPSSSTRTINSSIHPLWDNNNIQQQHHQQHQLGSRRRWWQQQLSWGLLICIISAIYLVVMVCYDYYWFYYYDDDKNDHEAEEYENILQTWPWFRPSRRTLLLFGAMSTEPVLQQLSYWRMLSSCFMCTSFMEWLVILLSWRLIMRLVGYNDQSPPQWHRWAGVYLSSTAAGQLWMMAWDGTNDATVGCVAWGTSAVLCHVGMDRPASRFVAFVLAAILLVMSLLQRPFGSVMGATGSTFFGWALSTSEAVIIWDSMTSPKAARQPAPASSSSGAASESLRWFSRIAALAILMLPALYIAFLT